MMLSTGMPAASSAWMAPFTLSSLQPAITQWVTSGWAVITGDDAVSAPSMVPSPATGKMWSSARPPSEATIAFSASVRSTQTDRSCFSTLSMPTFSPSATQPESVRNWAAIWPTLVPMSVPLNPANGTGLPSASEMMSSVAMTGMPASAAS